MRRKSLRHRPSHLPASRIILLFIKKFNWLILAIGVSGFITWTLTSDLFLIKKILCLHGERPCTEAVEAELASFIGKNILLFRADNLEKKLQAASISVQDVSVRAQLPHTIHVSLISRDATFSLSSNPDSTRVLLVDENLVPFKVQEKAKNSARIVSPRVSSLSLGEQIMDPILASSIKLAQTLNSHFIGFEMIETFNDRLQVVLKNKQLVVFAVDGDFSKSVPSLQLILGRSTILDKPKTIDLRFQKPVLRF